MNWNRYKMLIISGGITLLACGGLIFWLVSSSGAKADLEQDVKKAQRQQEALVGEELYPSKANLEALLAEQIKVRERHQALLSAIRDNQIQVRTISRSRFGDYVKDTVPALQGLAERSTRGGENGVVLRDPEFGLTPYLEGTLPTQTEVNRLVVEIETMKHLAGLLFGSGISELVSIKTVGEVEEEEPARPTFADNARSARQRGRSRRDQGPEEDKDLPLSVESEMERMFEAVTFEIEFKVYEDFFWETLNRFLADKNQIVISSLAITNSNTLLWPDYLQPVGKGTQREERRRRRRSANRDDALLRLLTDETEEAETAAVETKLPGLADRRRHLVGGDLIDVVLTLKVYRMKPQAAADEGEGV